MRFKNLLKLLSDGGNSTEAANGKVIYRTKDRVRDWSGRPPCFLLVKFDPQPFCSSVRPMRTGTILSERFMKLLIRPVRRPELQDGQRGKPCNGPHRVYRRVSHSYVALAIRRLNWTTDNQALSSALKGSPTISRWAGWTRSCIHSMNASSSKRARRSCRTRRSRTMKK